jgi:hypothetical protein
LLVSERTTALIRRPRSVVKLLPYREISGCGSRI